MENRDGRMEEKLHCMLAQFTLKIDKKWKTHVELLKCEESEFFLLYAHYESAKSSLS